MCKVLFSAISKTNPDPVKDRRGCIKRWMPVDAKDDAWAGDRSIKSYWNAEARTIPCTAPAGQTIATITIDTEENEAGVSGSMLNKMHGTMRCVGHAVVYLVQIKNITYQVTATQEAESWVVFMEGTSVLPQLIRGDFRRGIFQRALLTFNTSFATSTTALTIKNDPALWPGEVYLMNIPGVPCEKISEFLSLQTEDDAGVSPTTGEKSVYRKRRWSINGDALPPPALAALNSAGEYTTTVGAISNLLRRKRDNARYTGLDAPTVPTIYSSSLVGNTVTLTGEVFGTKVAAPFKYDDFQNGALGAYLNTTGWEHYAGASSSGPVFSSVRSHTGTQCAEVTTISTADNFNTAGLRGMASDEIYYSVWVYHELLSGTYSEGGPVSKIIRINSTPDFYDGSTSSPSLWITNFPSNGWTIAGMVNNAGGFTDQQDITSDQFTYGKWHRFEVHIRLSTPGGTDGACKVWHNGVLRYNHLTGTTRTASEAGKQIDNFLLPAMLDRGGQVIRYNMDGLYVDRSQSRVEVSTSPTWAGAIDRDVQVASSWSGTSITATLRADAFPSGAALYAYVIDANGATNQTGFRIR